MQIQISLNFEQKNTAWSVHPTLDTKNMRPLSKVFFFFRSNIIAICWWDLCNGPWCFTEQLIALNFCLFVSIVVSETKQNCTRFEWSNCLFHRIHATKYMSVFENWLKLFSFKSIVTFAHRIRDFFISANDFYLLLSAFMCLFFFILMREIRKIWFRGKFDGSPKLYRLNFNCVKRKFRKKFVRDTFFFFQFQMKCIKFKLRAFY